MTPLALDLSTDRREQLVDITAQVADALARAGISDGAVLVYCPHTTAGLTVQEHADPDVARDLLARLAVLAPRDAEWRHAEGNADAHVKASLVGSAVTIPVSGGRLALGTWQGIFFCEFDGPRRRRVLVQGLRGLA